MGAVVGSGLWGCPEGCIRDWGWGGGTRNPTDLSSGPWQSSRLRAERRLRDTPQGLLGNAPGLSCSPHSAGTEPGKRLGKGPAARHLPVTGPGQSYCCDFGAQSRQGPHLGLGAVPGSCLPFKP